MWKFRPKFLLKILMGGGGAEVPEISELHLTGIAERGLGGGLVKPREYLLDSVAFRGFSVCDNHKYGF
jgi:hypothetical protein